SHQRRGASSCRLGSGVRALQVDQDVVRALPAAPTVAQAVLDLRDVFTTGQVLRCQRMYVEAAALGLFGREPYSSSVRDSNVVWLDAVVGHLRAAGADAQQAVQWSALVDATVNGLMLDRPLDGDAAARAVVEDLASAIAG
ncbi:MAG: hypothetical protein ABWY58_01620, partial [Aeromicrobium sp.]